MVKARQLSHTIRRIGIMHKCLLRFDPDILNARDRATNRGINDCIGIV